MDAATESLLRINLRITDIFLIFSLLVVFPSFFQAKDGVAYAIVKESRESLMDEVGSSGRTEYHILEGFRQESFNQESS